VSAAAAYERSFREAIAAGKQPDALRRYCTDEVERFWSRTNPGPDGHVYWVGGESFVTNEGRHTQPRRWAWKRRHGANLSKFVSVLPACGEANCVAPAHLVVEARRHAPRRFTDDMAIGTAQVFAMRHGHPPGMKMWRSNPDLRPSTATVRHRFGSWDNFLRAAGLDPAKVPSRAVRFRWTDDDLIAAVRAGVAELGYVPSGNEWHRRFDAREDLPSLKTLTRRVGDGSWLVVLERAGLS